MNQAATPPMGALSHLGLLKFAGRDALGFLQGQISHDTRLLERGRVLRAAYSTPQGRVLAVIYLLPSRDGVLAIMPRELIEPTLERLRRFVLRSKVIIEDVTGTLSLVGAHSVRQLAHHGLEVEGLGDTYREQGDIAFARVPHDPHRVWLIGTAERMAALELAGDPAPVEAAWRLADIEAGLPQVYGATSEAFVAQMLNLDLVDGISFDKGCYTGQEIIARTQHLGRIKRRMFHLALPQGEWRIGQAIQLADGRHGRIAELAAGGDAMQALAVLNLAGTAETEADAAQSGTGAVQAREIALPYRVAAAVNA